jgi:hypothetical protein
MADRLGVETLDREGSVVVIRFRAKAKVDPLRLVRMVGEWPGAMLVPPATLKLDLEAAAEPRVPSRATGRTAASRRGERSSSWWTARATAGEVAGGFSRDEILARPETDPRASGGTFARVEALLRALA